MNFDCTVFAKSQRQERRQEAYHASVDGLQHMIKERQERLPLSFQNLMQSLRQLEGKKRATLVNPWASKSAKSDTTVTNLAQKQIITLLLFLQNLLILRVMILLLSCP